MIAKSILLVFLLSIKCCFSQEFTSGAIINQVSDTIVTKMVKTKKIKDFKLKYSIINILDSAGNTVGMSPKDIKGYLKEGDWYKAVNTIDRSFFIKQITIGKAELFIGPVNNDFKELCYYFRKHPSKEWVLLDNSFEGEFRIVNVQSTASGASQGNQATIETFKVYDAAKFVEYFSNYFSDCGEVINRLKNEWFILSDLEALFKCYNNKCN